MSKTSGESKFGRDTMSALSSGDAPLLVVLVRSKSKVNCLVSIKWTPFPSYLTVSVSSSSFLIRNRQL